LMVNGDRLNRLFVVNKPIFVSSNNYMYHIKRKYGTKKVGFSGTLDPFATGCLIVATGVYTKLFQFLDKTPKSYRATMWLGASSDSLDIENVTSIIECPTLPLEDIEKTLNSLIGSLTYLPPKYSAKKIAGKKAYDLAREGKDVKLKEITSKIYSVKLINYNHPFISFEIEVSEGSYIRSIAQEIASRLNVTATLSALHRINEGKFRYENEKQLNPFTYLKIPKNKFLEDEEILELGKKIDSSYFENRNSGTYLIETKNFYSIIDINEQEVKYRLNRIPKPKLED